MAPKDREPTFLHAPPAAEPQRRPASPFAAPVAEPQGPGILALAVSDMDRMLAAGLSNGDVAVWIPRLLAALPEITAPFLRGSRHGKPVRALAFCPRDPVGPEGSYHLLASGSVDRTILTWHLGDQGRNGSMQHHDSSVLALAWSPDGRLLASGSEDQTVALATADGTVVRRHQAHHGSVLTVAFSPDGSHYATGGTDGALLVWRADEPQIAAALRLGEVGWYESDVWSASFTADGQAILFAAGGAVGLWRAGSSTPVRRWTDPLERVTARAYTTAVSVDGGALATSFGTDVALLRADAETVELRRDHQAPVAALAFLADGRLASGDEAGRLCLWNRHEPAAPELSLVVSSG